MVGYQSRRTYIRTILMDIAHTDLDRLADNLRVKSKQTAKRLHWNQLMYKPSDWGNRLSNLLTPPQLLEVTSTERVYMNCFQSRHHLFSEPLRILMVTVASGEPASLALYDQIQICRCESAILSPNRRPEPYIDAKKASQIVYRPPHWQFDTRAADSCHS